MANTRSIWVSPINGGKDGWKVKNTDNQKASKIADTKKDAVDFATNLAKKFKTELIVQNKDGKIGSKDSFGNDECPPKDKEN